MNNSYLVLAEKYELRVKIPGKSGAYKVEGEKDLKHGKRLIKRSFVESRNAVPNNELYVLFEEETEKLMKKREQNIIDNQEKDRKSKMSTSDLVEAIAGKVLPSNSADMPSGTLHVDGNFKATSNGVDFDSMDIDQLKKHCDDNGIKYHHAAGINKLLEIIKS